MQMKHYCETLTCGFLSIKITHKNLLACSDGIDTYRGETIANFPLCLMDQ